jgi:hypothetical protein
LGFFLFSGPIFYSNEKKLVFIRSMKPSRGLLKLLLLLLLLLFTEIGVSPGGSSPYTSTHNTNGHINIHKSNNTIQTIHNYKTKYIQ